MEKRNCVNGGAAIEQDTTKCPFCGTSYFDMTHIDLASGEPFVLMTRVELNGYYYIISQLVRARQEDAIFDFRQDAVDYYSGKTKIGSFVRNNTLATSLVFTAVVRDDKTLCTMTKQK